MEEKKLQQWEKWHQKGKTAFLLVHVGGVAAFLTVTTTVAYVQLSMTKPSGVSLPLWPALCVICVLLPAAAVFGLWTWNRNEREYEDHFRNR